MSLEDQYHEFNQQNPDSEALEVQHHIELSYENIERIAVNFGVEPTVNELSSLSDIIEC